MRNSWNFSASEAAGSKEEAELLEVAYGSAMALPVCRREHAPTFRSSLRDAVH